MNIIVCSEKFRKSIKIEPTFNTHNKICNIPIYHWIGRNGGKRKESTTLKQPIGWDRQTAYAIQHLFVI
jgi:hypothetical protein